MNRLEIMLMCFHFPNCFIYFYTHAVQVDLNVMLINRMASQGRRVYPVFSNRI